MEIKDYRRICRNNNFILQIKKNKIWNKMLNGLDNEEISKILLSWIISANKYNIKSKLLELSNEFIQTGEVIH